MDAQSVLLARLDVIAENVDRAERALSSQALDDDLRSRMQVRFGKEFTRLRKDHKVVRQLVITSNPTGAAGRLAELDFSSQYVLGEFLAFLEGSLFRSARLDDGLCRIADWLVDRLSYLTEIGWRRLTIAGEGELFAGLSEIIRLKFPEFTIWRLPIVAHEFGHHVEKDFKSDELRQVIEDEAARSQLRPEVAALHLGEVFADTFAVYSTGPAFAYACLVLGFDPTRGQDDETHPSDLKRVHALLRALEKLNTGAYYGVIEELRTSWNKRAAAAGVPAEPTPDAAAALDFVLNEFHRILEAHAPQVRYAGWPTAVQLATTLGDGGANSARDVRDVLNGAWLARSQTWTSIGLFGSNIERNALARCDWIAKNVKAEGP